MRGHGAQSYKKIGEIAPGVPLKGDKTCCVFSVFKKNPIFCAGGFHVPKTAKMGTVGVGCFCAGYNSNGTILGDGNHFES